MKSTRVHVFALFAGLVACSSADPASPLPPVEESAPSPPKPAAPKGAAPAKGASSSNTNTWCLQQGGHSFCADFDGADPTENWQVFGDRTLIGTTASDRSDPYALSIARPAAEGGVRLLAAVPKTAPKGIRLAMDMRVDSSGLTGTNFYEQPIVIQLAEASKQRIAEGITFELRTDGSAVTTDLQAFSLNDAASDNIAHALVTTLPRDRWVNVSLVVDISSPSTLRASVAYDGVGAGEVTVKRAPASLTAARLLVGTASREHAGPAPFVVGFDNVLFDVE